jgi:hypothetical protein
MGVDMSNNKSTYILGGIIFLGLIAMVSWPIGAATASTNDPKNGWGEATSERTTEQEEPSDFGDHTSDPDDDGTKGNNNQDPDDDDNDHRSGIGNVGDTEENNLHPSDLGEFLDDIDCDVDPGESGPENPDDC